MTDRENQTTGNGPAYVLPRQQLRPWIQYLIDRFAVVGPVRDNGAVMLRYITSPDDLTPPGAVREWPGGYSLLPPAGRGEPSLDCTRPMNSPKYFLHWPVETLFRASKNGDGLQIEETIPNPRPQVLLGVLPCDVHGTLLLDRVFYSRGRVDPYYDARRSRTTIVAVTCTTAADTCFCHSMGTGPTLEGKVAHDLLLTSLEDVYLVEIVTPKGNALVEHLGLPAATSDHFAEKSRRVSGTIAQMKKHIKTDGMREVLNATLNHPYWKETTDRCLACGNCVLVCPSCYCYDIVDLNDSTLQTVTRQRSWIACYYLEFARVHGFNFRKEHEARLKQFFLHKLNYWVDQYGAYGCIGCGRCITWCPTAIDITEIVHMVSGGAK